MLGVPARDVVHVTTNLRWATVPDAAIVAQADKSYLTTAETGLKACK